MNTNVNLEAALGVLAFVGVGFVLLLLVIVIAHALVTRRRARARRALIAGAAGVCLYAAGVLAFSLASGAKVLARGEEKYFCEIDCHLAYSVVGVERRKTVGAPPGEATAAGEFYVVTVRTRFDENTVSPRRGPAPLAPNPRALTVSDERGREYAVSLEGQGALERAGAAGAPLTTSLRPGETYTTTLVFDLPPDAREPLLLIRESDAPTRFIIGHENSPLHARTKFRLGP